MSSRRSYTVEEKEKVVQVAMAFGPTKAAKMLNIHHSMVSRWMRQQEVFKRAHTNARKIGSGRRRKRPLTESDLVDNVQSNLLVDTAPTDQDAFLLASDSMLQHFHAQAEREMPLVESTVHLEAKDAYLNLDPTATTSTDRHDHAILLALADRHPFNL